MDRSAVASSGTRRRPRCCSDHPNGISSCCPAAGCQYVFNVYDDGRDVGFFMCNDRINALIVDVLSRDNQFDAILGCQDKVIRVIRVRPPPWTNPLAFGMAG